MRCNNLEPRFAEQLCYPSQTVPTGKISNRFENVSLAHLFILHCLLTLPLATVVTSKQLEWYCGKYIFSPDVCTLCYVLCVFHLFLFVTQSGTFNWQYHHHHHHGEDGSRPQRPLYPRNKNNITHYLYTNY